MSISDDESAALGTVQTDSLAEQPDDPPVVARMVVEIRSDGSRTIARGAIEDIETGTRAAIEAKGSTPMALAASLAKTMFQTPFIARRAVKQLLLGRRSSRRDE